MIGTDQLLNMEEIEVYFNLPEGVYAKFLADENDDAPNLEFVRDGVPCASKRALDKWWAAIPTPEECWAAEAIKMGITVNEYLAEIRADFERSATERALHE